MSAARKLAQIHPEQKIILVDAQLAGEGASGRNSGYLVDTTLNDGFTSNKELSNYKKKTDIYNLGIKSVKKFVKEYQVDCDWNECGKFFASSNNKDRKILTSFSETLSKLGFEHNILSNSELKKRLGTNFYNIALHTKGGILLHPGKLVRAMIDTLPINVKLFENSPMLEWKKNNDRFESLSWEEIEISVKSIARSLLDLGIMNGDRVVILSENRPEWQIADLAIMSIGAISVPVYTTSTTDDYSHVINHSAARCIIISSHELCLKALPAIEKSTDCKNVIKINEDNTTYNNPVNIYLYLVLHS